MSQTVRTLGAAALGAFIVAVAALSVRPGPAAGAPATDAPAAHTITVSGSGKITVVPDVARIYLGVTVTKPTVKAARQAGAQAMTDIIAAVKALGVAEADIQTTNVSLNPQYGSGSAPKVVGYQISEQIEVTVRDLDKAGDVVDATTAAGATNVNGISFELADPVKATNDARAAAVVAARTSAQAMASAGNVSLGAVVSITDATQSVADLLRVWRAQGSRRDPGCRDPGPAGHPGPERHGHGRLRDQLPRRPRLSAPGRGPAAQVPSGGATHRPGHDPRRRPVPGERGASRGSPRQPAPPSSTAPPIRPPPSRFDPSRRWRWPASPARWPWSRSSGWPSPGSCPGRPWTA